MDFYTQDSQYVEIIEGLKEGTIPAVWPDGSSDWGSRQIVTTEYNMWAMVDQRLCGQMAEWLGDRAALEVMGGAGWLTKGLREAGATVVCTEDFSWAKTKQRTPFTVTEVVEMDAVAAVKQYGRNMDVLIMSWIPYCSPIGAAVAEIWEAQEPGRPIIVIGEEPGGCTADNEFNSRYVATDHFTMSNWRNINDAAMIGTYDNSRPIVGPAYAQQ